MVAFDFPGPCAAPNPAPCPASPTMIPRSSTNPSAWSRSTPREGRVRRPAPDRPGQARPLPPTPPRRHLPGAPRAPANLPARAAHTGRGRAADQRRDPRLPAVPGPAGPPPDPPRRGPPQGRHRLHRGAHRPLRPPARLPGPWFTGSASDPLPPRDDPQRRTFNFDLVEAGWAAMFLIYPSLPQHDDLHLLLGAAQAAWDGRRGAWAEFGDSLLLAMRIGPASSSPWRS
jgi:hypothetical protein